MGDPIGKSSNPFKSIKKSPNHQIKK